MSGGRERRAGRFIYRRKYLYAATINKESRTERSDTFVPSTLWLCWLSRSCACGHDLQASAHLRLRRPRIRCPRGQQSATDKKTGENRRGEERREATGAAKGRTSARTPRTNAEWRGEQKNSLERSVPEDTRGARVSTYTVAFRSSGHSTESPALLSRHRSIGESSRVEEFRVESSRGDSMLWRDGRRDGTGRDAVVPTNCQSKSWRMWRMRQCRSGRPKRGTMTWLHEELDPEALAIGHLMRSLRDYNRNNGLLNSTSDWQLTRGSLFEYIFE